MSGITSRRLTFKSPGPIDSNYAGPWDFNIANYTDILCYQGPIVLIQPMVISILFRPIFMMTPVRHCTQVSIGHAPDLGQNIRLYFAISRDNGQTWSQPIDVSNTDVGNRGFPYNCVGHRNVVICISVGTTIGPSLRLVMLIIMEL